MGPERNLSGLFDQRQCILKADGPFKLAQWISDQKVVLQRNQDYYGEKAQIDQVMSGYAPSPRGFPMPNKVTVGPKRTAG